MGHGESSIQKRNATSALSCCYSGRNSAAEGKIIVSSRSQYTVCFYSYISFSVEIWCLTEQIHYVAYPGKVGATGKSQQMSTLSYSYVGSDVIQTWIQLYKLPKNMQPNIEFKKFQKKANDKLLSFCWQENYRDISMKLLGTELVIEEVT